MKTSNRDGGEKVFFSVLIAIINPQPFWKKAPRIFLRVFVKKALCA